MSKVTFATTAKRLYTPEHGMHSSHEYLACDLARPSAELAAVAALMSSVPWISNALVQDSTLYVQSDYTIPYALQVRALHNALTIARTVLAEGLAAMPAERAKPSPRPEVANEAYCSRPSTYVRNADDRQSTQYAMPEGCYQPGMLIVEREGRLQGHLLVSERHNHPRTDLAIHLMQMLAPDAGIVAANRMAVCEEMYLSRHLDGIEDLGAACLRIAGGMIAAMKDRVRKLKYEGHPTAFLDEDDDARDVLLGLMAAGSTVTASRIKNQEHDFSGTEPEWVYHLDDGSEAPYHVVQRLLEAQLIHPSDGRWGASSTLVATEGLTHAQMKPRTETVSFDIFQSACRFRRYPDDGEQECLSQAHHGYHSYCEAESCPLLDRVHEGERGNTCNYRSILNDDPAFERHQLGERHDTMMVARHPNTKRSRAWRYAGESRMHGIVNQVLGSHFTYGIPMLVEAMHDDAVDQAVAQGWLEIDERNALGSITRVSEKLLGEVERQRKEYEAHVPA